MRKKKAGSIILLATFIIVICFHWLWWILLEKYVDSTNYENRVLAGFPDFSLERYDDFPAEFEAYYNDNLSFRNNLVTLNAAIDYYVFGRSANEDVIVGKDNWLFYSDKSDGDPVSCYQGTNLLNKKALRRIANNCVKTNDFLKKQGKEFVIFIAPNKERIYNEYMPEQYGAPSDIYRALQVVNYLRKKTDVRVVYPYEELMEAKSTLPYNIFYKTDTHWNYLGGYVGATALLAELGINVPDIDSREVSIAVGDETAGDLAGMLNLSNMLKENDQEYTLSGYEGHNMEILEFDFNNAIVCRAENADQRKLYVCRDSFFSQMAVYVGSQFNDSCFRHRNSYTYDDFLQQDPDIFVYEVAERYVKKLEKFSLQQGM